MRKIRTSFFLASLATIAAATPALAHEHLSIGIGLGGFYPHYYDGYYPPAYYVAPPPVVYVQPQPTVVYTAPATQTIVVPAPTQTAITIDPSSPAFTDSSGHTCRQYQSGTTKGMACLQADGAWHVVP